MSFRNLIDERTKIKTKEITPEVEKMLKKLATFADSMYGLTKNGDKKFHQYQWDSMKKLINDIDKEMQ